MSDESKVSKADILEQMQAGHRARIDGAMLENWNKDAVLFQQIVPEAAAITEAEPQPEPENQQPDSYRSYASKLLEEMRGVYASSWDDCSCGSSPSWKGGHNHFYDPCSGADNPPPSDCPVYDCDNTCCHDHHHHQNRQNHRSRQNHRIIQNRTAAAALPRITMTAPTSCRR